ncbi:hypothetical protein AVEN_125624-1 [Araneus ventricosus]|uniref:Uncharacterized protein n=1 Tax=Araneus ventricosus TaxID=182803 RepID=A0A4Y2J0W8_ARAVE|nr:hypothetical protein AVEN_125624-1 [Araneus ventricosus]
MSKNLKRSERARASLDATTGRMDSCLVTIRGLRELAEREASLVQSALRDMENNLIDPGYTLELTKSIHRSGSRNIDDYIKRNTEILLNEHATVVRQNVIQKMKNQIREMNEEMSQEARKLGDDISNFFEFIQNSYSQASNSFRKVTEIAKRNYEKVVLTMVTEDKLFTLNNELRELEQQLLECLMCSEFLKTLSPEKYEKEAFHIRKDACGRGERLLGRGDEADRASQGEQPLAGAQQPLRQGGVEIRDDGARSSQGANVNVRISLHINTLTYPFHEKILQY